MEVKIRYDNIKAGDKIKAIETYSSYGANEQVTEYLLEARDGAKGLELIKEDGEEFRHGINSGYQYYKITNKNNMTCSKCGGDTAFKQGVKKETGKPWSGYFCQNQECKNVDWSKASPKPNSEPKPPQPNGFQILTEEVIGMRDAMLTKEYFDEFKKGLFVYLEEKLEKKTGKSPVNRNQGNGGLSQISEEDFPAHVQPE